MRLSQIKQWAIGKCFRWLPDEESELWKWSYTGAVMHDAWIRPNFEHQIEQATEGVYLVPLLSPEYCDWLVEQAEALAEWSEDKTDDYAAMEINLSRLNFGAVVNYHKEIIVKNNFNGRVFNGLYQWQCDTLHKAFLIKYTPDSIKEMHQHYDEHSLISISINLNDDFEGGELSFIRSPGDRVRPYKGWGAVFAGNPTMTHTAHPITSGVRYVLVYWVR